ncbi:hypothetical protein [Brevibacillus sp. MER 51]|uniref:hypothetical protein n=1 Tax=Brevibacillus sp. MER 51 TaxID=2939560 RepID=UPI0020422CD8|nr:hypothetical protein [Brevibacillus sp. MER 51]MCM3145367.1 hypothetical protein [Brevibacillus sp. MER 51]
MEKHKRIFSLLTFAAIGFFFLLVFMFLSKLFFLGFGFKFEKEIKIEDYVAFMNMVLTGVLSYAIFKVTKVATNLGLQRKAEEEEAKKTKLKFIIRELTRYTGNISSVYDTALKSSVSTIGFKMTDERLIFSLEYVMSEVENWNRVHNELRTSVDLLVLLENDWPIIETVNSKIKMIQRRLPDILNKHKSSSNHDPLKKDLINNFILNDTISNLNQEIFNPIRIKWGLEKVTSHQTIKALRDSARKEFARTSKEPTVKTKEVPNTGEQN